MDKFRNMTVYLTISCDDNPVLTSIMIFFAFLFTNSILAHIESLIFGEPIRYWFDVFLAVGFMAWAVYATHVCACRKIIKMADGRIRMSESGENDEDL